MGSARSPRATRPAATTALQVGSAFENEEVWNFETGIKTVFPAQDLLLNSSVYYYKYSNRQSLTLDRTRPAPTCRGTWSTPATRRPGAWSWRHSGSRWTTCGSASTGAYIDATYSKAVAPSGVSLSGQPTGEPKFSFAAALGYTWHAVAGGKLEANVNHAFRGESRCNRDSQLQGTCQVSPNFGTGASRNAPTRAGLERGEQSLGRGGLRQQPVRQALRTGVSNISASVFGTPYASITPPRMGRGMARQILRSR